MLYFLFVSLSVTVILCFSRIIHLFFSITYSAFFSYVILKGENTGYIPLFSNVKMLHKILWMEYRIFR
jgi:hypothetical protein